MTRDGTFTYTSEPHSAPRLFSQTMPSRAVPLTMMSDPRVVRGNTHALAKKVAKSRADDAKDRTVTKIVEQQTTESQLPPPSMPSYSFVTKPFVDGSVDIMQYLVEADSYVPTKNVESQVDAFTELPPVEKYIPRKTGIDKSTHIDDQTELFVFDIEVTPMLEVIVSKTIEQALIEVEHEFELVRLQEEVLNYEEQMRNESNWILEQENHIRQKHDDIRQRLHSVLATKAAERSVKLGIAGCQMARQLLPGMVDAIHAQMLEAGTWKKPDEEVVKNTILPLLQSQVASNVDLLGQSFCLVDEIIRDVAIAFDGIEKTTIEIPQRNLVVHIIRSDPADEEKSEEESKNSAKEKVKEIVFELPIKPNDSAFSLQKRLQDNINALNQPVTTDDGDKPPDLVISGDFSLLPKINAALGQIYNQAGLPSIDMAADALMYNFPWTSDITVFFHI